MVNSVGRGEWLCAAGSHGDGLSRRVLTQLGATWGELLVWGNRVAYSNCCTAAGCHSGDEALVYWIFAVQSLLLLHYFCSKATYSLLDIGTVIVFVFNLSTQTGNSVKAKPPIPIFVFNIPVIYKQEKCIPILILWNQYYIMRLQSVYLDWKRNCKRGSSSSVKIDCRYFTKYGPKYSELTVFLIWPRTGPAWERNTASKRDKCGHHTTRSCSFCKSPQNGIASALLKCAN